MKKISFVFFIFLISNSLNAAGVFEIPELAETYNVKVGQGFSTYINFYYSGTGYKPKVSITGQNLPDGISLGTVEEKGGGLYGVVYSGTVKSAGTYPLTLLLSDGYGAMLTKKFIVKADPLIFTDQSLPEATVYKPYSINLNFIFPNNDVYIKIADAPESFSFDFLNINAQNNSFNLKLTPTRVGNFSFTVDAYLISDTYKKNKIGQKTFNLNVKEVEKITPISLPTVNISPQIKEEIAPIKKPTNKEVKNIPEKKTQQTATNTLEVKKIETKLVVPSAMYPNVVTTSDAKAKIKWYEKVFNWFQGF